MEKLLTQHFDSVENLTTTTNGANAYKKTNSALLDFFAHSGSMRQNSDSEIINLFVKAFNEEPLLAMKSLFYSRNIRGVGQGERRLFKVIAKYLAYNYPNVLKKNLHLISEFGRWDDYLVLLETPLKNDVLKLLREQFLQDLRSLISNDSVSLLGKWLPSVNASSNETVKYGKIIAKFIFPSENVGKSYKLYRKALSNLRKQIQVVEAKMSSKKWSDIRYEAVPSKAMFNYRNAFSRNDGERYEDYLNSVSRGEVKINTSSLYPHEIVGQYLTSCYLRDETIELMWKNLENHVSDEDSLVVADVSGSMTTMNSLPLKVSIGLAIYIAERNKGVWNNKFLTFSSNPQLQKLVGKELYEKVFNLSRADWGMSTDIYKTMRLILDLAVKNALPKEDMIKKLYIVSDMQFDEANNQRHRVSLFEDIEAEFNLYGYKMPHVVFWNVNSHLESMPFQDAYNNKMTMVSGFSPSILQAIMGGEDLNAYDLMLKTINSVPNINKVTV